MFGATSSRFTQLARTVASSPAQTDLPYSSTASVNAQFWLGQFPWRPTAAWAAVAALLAQGGLVRLHALDWQAIALTLLLVDPLWGSIWRLAAGRREVLSLHSQSTFYRPWLPYLQPSSPAYKLLVWNDTGVLPLLFRIALPGVGITLALALVLGWPAVWLTAAVIVVSALGWTSRRTFHTAPVLLQSVVTIALPWLLIVQQGANPAAADVWSMPHLILVALLTCHHWGEGRLLRNGANWLGRLLLALSEIGLVLLLVIAQQPLWLSLLIILWLPAWLLISQQQPLMRANFWWLLALLVAALGVSNMTMFS